MNAEQKRRAERILSEWHEGKYSAAQHGVEMASLLHELVGAAQPSAYELNMDAYYYSFSQTGVFAIDRILSAVACAGKAFHHTSQWQDECSPYAGHVGVTPIDWIQNAANDAAKTYNVAPVSNIDTLQSIRSILALDEAVTGAVMKVQVLKLLLMQVSNRVYGTTLFHTEQKYFLTVTMKILRKLFG